jgi:hypothetical protein
MEHFAEDEAHCEYVSSRGILKSCDIHNPVPKSSSDFLDPTIYANIPAGSTVYVCTEAIPNFLKNFLPSAKGPVVVVSGDSDLSFPTDTAFLNDPKILHWFAQNSTGNHPKLSSIPIGLDYHTVAQQDHHWSPKMSPKHQENQIKEFAAIEPKLSRRDHRAYGNFLLNISRGNRREAYEQIPKEVMIYETGFVVRKITWWKQASAAFTVSPHGNGLDCHRTWETLVLGGVPIVESSSLDCLYEGLPVLIVKSWADICKEKLEATLQAFEQRPFEVERLRLSYWLQKIKAKTK